MTHACLICDRAPTASTLCQTCSVVAGDNAGMIVKLQRLSRYAVQIWVNQPRPIERYSTYSGCESPLWWAWHWARDIDPLNPPIRKHRSAIAGRLRAAVIARDGLLCGICGEQVSDATDVHIDHIKPVFRGGSTELSNLQVAHSFCNLSKGSRMEILR
jgi:hypothetical protein